jgi:phytoene desaturase
VLFQALVCCLYGMEKQSVVIGSGIAGLASSVHLARKGYKVLVLEQHATFGGKLGVFNSNGYRFDMGPSLFTMPNFVYDLLDDDLSEQFNVHRLETLCHYFWDSPQPFAANADLDQFTSEASRYFHEDEQNIKSFLKKSKLVYDITSPVFLENSLHKIKTYLSKTGIKGIANLWRLDMFKTMNNSLEQRFSNDKLIQLFNRYATYNGSNPYQAPATLNVIPHLEFHYGAYLPKKGMRAIAEIIHEQATRLGVEFKFNSTVKNVRKKSDQIVGIQVSSGVEYPCDVCISDVDAKVFYCNLLKDEIPRKIEKAENSSSALIFYWGINKSFENLDVHNILFSGNYREEFNHLFQHKTIQSDPTVYIHISSKVIPNDAPDGCENWFVMVNVPHNDGQDWEAFRAEARERIIHKINTVLQTDISPLIETEDFLDPILIEQRTSSDKGSLYGSSSNDRMSAFFRQANFTSSYKNLYFCGGSVHPGGGIPLCLLGANILNKIIPDAKD